MLADVLISFLTAVACPAGMVSTGEGTCIDILPYPNYPDSLATITVSALPITIDKGSTWDAVSLCKHIGKRTCNLSEWKSACYGTPAMQCNVNKTWRIVDWDLVAKRDSNHLWWLDQRSTADVYPNCIADSGARMMIGNVAEWVRDKGQWVLVGGYWADDPTPTCNNRIVNHSRRWQGYFTGTRCCYD